MVEQPCPYLMTTNTINGGRGQVLIAAVIVILILLLAIVGVELFITRTGGIPSVQEQPRKDPATGLYTVYIVVNGHRDLTILHQNFHSNIHIDFVTYYFSTPPNPLSGRSWTDFSKPIHVTVTVTGPYLIPSILHTFDLSVSIGAHWGQVLTYTLLSGNYTIEAQSVDQDGFRSSSTAQLVLP